MSEGYKKKEIEDAILETLRPLGAAGGGYLRVLSAYRGELETGGLLMEAIQLPAILVSHASSTFSTGPYLHLRETMGFNVVAICRAGLSPDVFSVLDDVRELLSGSRLGLNLSPAALLRETSLMRGPDVEAYSALYTLGQSVEIKTQSQIT